MQPTFLAHLPSNIRYIGIDSNQKYIDFAQENINNDHQTFLCGNWSTIEWSQNIRVVSLLGLYILPDEQVKQVITLSLRNISHGGSLFH